MIKGILTSAWILAAIAALVLGLKGSINPAVMVTFSLGAIAVLYGFALWTVIVNTREPQEQKVKPG